MLFFFFLSSIEIIVIVFIGLGEPWHHGKATARTMKAHSAASNENDDVMNMYKMRDNSYMLLTSQLHQQ
uniref:Putative secreted protein n=1 Tax=Ixodes ricinus TaxID=34613 RepID=A0A147BNM9_IXORI